MGPYRRKIGAKTLKLVRLSVCLSGLSVCPSFQSLEPKRLAVAKNDQELTPPEIGRGPYRNQVFFIWVINCVIKWSLMVINAGTGQTIGRSEKRMKQKSF